MRFHLGGLIKDPVGENEGDGISQIFMTRKGDRKTTYTENKGSLVINKSRFDHYTFPLSPVHSMNMKVPIIGGNKPDFPVLIESYFLEIFTNVNPHVGFSFSQDSPLEKKRGGDLRESKNDGESFFNEKFEF